MRRTAAFTRRETNSVRTRTRINVKTARIGISSCGGTRYSLPNRSIDEQEITVGKINHIDISRCKKLLARREDFRVVIVLNLCREESHSFTKCRKNGARLAKRTTDGGQLIWTGSSFFATTGSRYGDTADRDYLITRDWKEICKHYQNEVQRYIT